jgi:hypothetical protein
MLLPGDETNPILYVEELRRFPWRRPRSVPGAAHVYLGRHDRFYQPEGGLTLGELWWLGPRRLYVVDVAPHELVLSHEVTSPDGAVTVAMAVSFCWRIDDPRFVVQSGLVDVMTVVPAQLGRAVDAAVSRVTWRTGPDLAAALLPGVLPERIVSDGVELSGLRGEMLTVEDRQGTGRDPDA